jgi:dienelactone hydrolase
MRDSAARGPWIAGALVVALLLVGCGGRTTPAPPTASPEVGPSAVEVCARAGSGWRAFDVRAHGARLNAAVLGEGEVGVVFANQSGNSTCDWLPFATELARDRRRAVVFEYDDQASAASELLAVARALHAAGARRVAIVGASIGGRAVIQAAARDRGSIAAAVSLSAERSVGALPEILPDARRVRVPSLYVGSREDGYTTFGRETRQFHHVTPAKVNHLLLVPGGKHGVDLLPDPHVRATIVEFLNANAG